MACPSSERRAGRSAVRACHRHSTLWDAQTRPQSFPQQAGQHRFQRDHLQRGLSLTFREKIQTQDTINAGRMCHGSNVQNKCDNGERLKAPFQKFREFAMVGPAPYWKTSNCFRFTGASVNKYQHERKIGQFRHPHAHFAGLFPRSELFQKILLDKPEIPWPQISCLTERNRTLFARPHVLPPETSFGNVLTKTLMMTRPHPSYTSTMVQLELRLPPTCFSLRALIEQKLAASACVFPFCPHFRARLAFSLFSFAAWLSSLHSR